MQTSMNELMTQSAPEDKVARQTEILRHTFEGMLGNMRELTELMAKSNNECADVLSKRFSESLNELKKQVETLKKQA
jgi:phasin family protein